MSLVEPTLVELQKILTKPTTSDTDRLRAIQIVLDRTGLHAKTDMTIEHEIKPWEGLVDGILRKMEERDQEIIEAEVVEEEDEGDGLDGVRDVLAEYKREVAEREPSPTAASGPPQRGRTATGQSQVVNITSHRWPPSHLR